jgi:hypothetical protein
MKNSYWYDEQKRESKKIFDKFTRILISLGRLWDMDTLDIEDSRRIKVLVKELEEMQSKYK